jgi:HK97 family phage major capsid protein
MDKIWVEMLKAWDNKPMGEKVELDAATGKQWVEAGLAKAVETDPVSETIKEFEKSLQARDEKLVHELSISIAKSEVKCPAIPKSHDEDKPGEGFWTCVGITGSANSTPDAKQKAHNILIEKHNAGIPKGFLEQSVGTAGGFLVPVKYINELERIEGYDSVAFPDRVRIIPCEGRVVNKPALDQTITPSGATGLSAFFGGVSVTWVAEGVAPGTYTQPAFKQLTWTVQKAIAVTQVTNEMLAMSPISVEGEVGKDLRGAMITDYDYNVFQGAGTGQLPFNGIINNNASIKVLRQTNGAVSLLDIANMWAKLAPKSRKRACWFINPSVWAQLPMLGSTGGAAAHFVWLGNSATGQPQPYLFGLPVIDTECLPSLGNIGDVVLADLTAYIVALNKNIVVDASPHYAFPSDLTTYRMTTLAMGMPQLTAPVQLLGGGTVSPFVQLDTQTS